MSPDLFHLASGPAEFVVTGVWQGLLVIGAAWISLKAAPTIAPRIAPRTRFLLWMAAFLLAALLPLAGLFAPAGSAALPARAGAVRAARLSAGWALALAGLWALASLFSLLRLAVNGFRLHRLAQTSTPLPAESLDLELRSLLDQPGSRPIALRLSGQLDSPMVAGFFYSVILLPDWLWKKLTPSEAKQVVMHEIAHLKRGDDWTNLLQKFFCALFPLNPALLWAERQLCREREMACDDAVLDRAVAPREYAASLASLAEKRLLRHAQSLAPGAWRRRSELAERVHRILESGHRLNVLSARPVIAIFFAGFLGCGALLARSPRVVTFLPPSVPVPAGESAALRSLPLSGPPLNDGRKLSSARFEQASLRVAVSPGASPRVAQEAASAAIPPAGFRGQKAKQNLAPALAARRARCRHDSRELYRSGLSAPTFQPEIVLAVWEISSPLAPLPVLVPLAGTGFSYSDSISSLQTAAPASDFASSFDSNFDSNGSWIVFQL